MPNRTTLITTHLRPFVELCSQMSQGLPAVRDWPGVRQTGERPGSIFFPGSSSCGVIHVCLIRGRALRKIPILLDFSWPLVAVPSFLEWVLVPPWTPSYFLCSLGGSAGSPGPLGGRGRRGRPLPHFLGKRHLSSHIYLTAQVLQSRPCPRVPSAHQETGIFEAQTSWRNGAVFIKFPSFCYFPKALTSARGLISFLLLLIIFS